MPIFRSKYLRHHLLNPSTAIVIQLAGADLGMPNEFPCSDGTSGEGRSVIDLDEAVGQQNVSSNLIMLKSAGFSD